MPITKLDEKAALIIFDQQNYNRALDVDFVIPLQEVIDRTVKLAEAFGRRNWLCRQRQGAQRPRDQADERGTQPGGRVERGYVRPPGNAENWLGESWHDFVPELEPHPEDLVIVKPCWDSFIGTTLDCDLRQQGVTQVFGTDADAYKNSVEKVFPRISERTTIDEALKLIA